MSTTTQFSTKVKHGDYVTCSRHGHKGRVFEAVMLTDEDMSWARNLTIKPTKTQLNGRWIRVLTYDGTAPYLGSVCVPEDSLTVTDPFEFKHMYAHEHFDD